MNRSTNGTLDRPEDLLVGAAPLEVHLFMLAPPKEQWPF